MLGVFSKNSCIELSGLTCYSPTLLVMPESRNENWSLLNMYIYSQSNMVLTDVAVKPMMGPLPSMVQL